MEATPPDRSDDHGGPADPPGQTPPDPGSSGEQATALLAGLDGSVGPDPLAVLDVASPSVVEVVAIEVELEVDEAVDPVVEATVVVVGTVLDVVVGLVVVVVRLVVVVGLVVVVVGLVVVVVRLIVVVRRVVVVCDSVVVAERLVDETPPVVVDAVVDGPLELVI